MLRRPFVYYLDGRLYEWGFSAAMVSFGVGLFVWPGMVRGSIMQILEQVLGWPATALVFLLTGIATMGALIANGNSMWIGPRVRSVCAVVRSVLWTSFTLSMIKVSFGQPFPSPMVFFWPFFTAIEIYIAYRAVLDVRSD